MAVNKYKEAHERAAAATREFAEMQDRITRQIREKHEEERSDVERLAELANAEKLCNSEREEAMRLIREMNRAIPNLALEYNELTGEISMSTEELNKFFKIQEEGRRRQSIKQRRAHEDKFQQGADEIWDEFGGIGSQLEQ